MKTLPKSLAALGLSACLLIVILAARREFAHTPPTVRVGVLHSLTGTMATSEKPLVDALQLAIEEANAGGGINGRKIEAQVVDCRSDAAYCAQQAERLITQEKVQALFGCWTSVCRKAVKAVVEKHRHLLFYPLRHEGMEQSPNIIYTGAAPNQQMIPATNWALDNLGKRVYLVGSDYVFPRMANILIKDLLNAHDAVLIRERYLPLDATDCSNLVDDIARQQPDVVVSTLNGNGTIALFKALDKAGIGADAVPVLSFTVAEVELAKLDTPLMAGHYAAWNYFQSIPSAHNQEFVQRFRNRFGRHAVLDDPMEASYVGMRLWVQAAREADSTEPARVQHTILRQTLHAPEGVVALDPDTRHLWKTVRIGRARRDGQFDIVWDSGRAIEPAPFPSYHTRSEWATLLHAAASGKP